MKSTKSTKRKPKAASVAGETESCSGATNQSVENMAKRDTGEEKPSEGSSSTDLRSAKPTNSRSAVERATEGLVRLELQRRRRSLLRWFLAACVVLGIGYAIHTALSTWLGMDPITHVWELIRVRLPLNETP